MDKKEMLIIAVIAVALWYFCIITVPAIPNGACPAGLSAPGASGGYSGGSSGGSCPAPTTCQSICPSGTNFDTASMCCREPARPDGSLPCPEQRLTNGFCDCPTGYIWDTGFQRCEPGAQPRSMPCPYTPTTSGFCACPMNYYWDTGNQACVYSGAV